MTFISVSTKSYPYQDLQLNKNYHHQKKPHKQKNPTLNQNQATNKKKQTPKTNKKNLEQNHLWPQYKYTQEKKRSILGITQQLWNSLEINMKVESSSIHCPIPS